MRPHDIDGAAGEPLDIPQSVNPAGLEATSNGAVRFTTVPFHPRGFSAFAATGAMFTGYPDDYRFEVHHPDGRVTVIERAWDPVPVLADEAAAHHRAVTAYLRGMDSGWTWNGPEIPATKPAYTDFAPAVSGEVWVVRPGRGILDPGCDETPSSPMMTLPAGTRSASSTSLTPMAATSASSKHRPACRYSPGHSSAAAT